MLRKVYTILSGNAAAALLLLVRNLVVARLIPVEDYGIAATFAVTMALVEMSTQFGLQQQIVQDKDGEDAHFQAALQGFQLMRGLVAGALLFVLAETIADLLRIPDVAWAYQVMAVMPVLRALQHFDIHRLNRQMRFGPLLYTSVIPALVALIAVFPLAIWMGDYRVMLFSLVLQEALGALTSHLLAERRYRLAFDAKIMGRSLQFGWPLLLNGVLLFCVMQGDKIIIGRELGMAALGIFGMGVTLTLTPTLILAKSVQSLFLPQLSAAVDQPEEWARLNTVTLQAVMFLSLLFAGAIVIVNAPLVNVVLGEKFAALIEILPWMGLMFAFRILKVGPAVIAIAAGRTAKLAWANVPRAVLLVPAAWFAITGGDLITIVLIALVGELLGFMVTMYLATEDVQLSRDGLLAPTAATVASLAVVTLAASGCLPGPLWIAPALCAATLVLTATIFHPLLAFIHPKRSSPC